MMEMKRLDEAKSHCTAVAVQWLFALYAAVWSVGKMVGVKRPGATRARRVLGARLRSALLAAC
ncbi:hypothetical protein QCO44_06600 [Selenomonas sputigena]|uniref:Uncharacterized protein n=1 Tax=Selenomonas sputigena TaxID=69823 RepID=A0ABV3X5C9_9FIRM